MSGQAAAEYYFVKTGLIWLFSGALVFLGAVELHKRHARHASPVRKDAHQMLLELHGDLDIARMVKDPQALKAQVQERNQVQAQRRDNLRREFEKLVP